VNHMMIRRAGDNAEDPQQKLPLNMLKGQVSGKGEGLSGLHADFTLAIGDECSGVEDIVYNMFQGWADHMVWIGNPNQCQNFWRRNIKAGDLPYEARKIA